ncbi:MAG: hypothetical protein D6720_11805 [Gammaproteobacteria bacterium]|nr:MAG: hypothetical protein D6720_11805 [Gammaproteobacteria bacterium]
MTTEASRMLLAFEQQMRTINREVLNPVIDSLSPAKLEPMLRMVAKARALYLQELLKLADGNGGELPDDQQIKVLHQRRLRYDELVEAAQALETAIQRGYLDVSTGTG